MVKPIEKRESEIKVFRKFCQLYGLNPTEFDSPDNPDFLKKDASLGVELVEYHRDQHIPSKTGSLKRTTEARWFELVDESRKEFEKQSQVRMDVLLFPRLHQKEKIPFSKSFMKQATLDLVNLVHQYKSQGVKLGCLSSQHTLPPDLSNYISQLWIYPTPLYKQRSSWNPVEAAILEVVPAAVFEAIQEKINKIERYKAKAKEIWLLIHASPRPHIRRTDLGRESTVGKITEELRQLQFQSNFDRIYYLDEDEPELICLNQI